MCFTKVALFAVLSVHRIRVQGLQTGIPVSDQLLTTFPETHCDVKEEKCRLLMLRVVGLLQY